MGPKIMDGSVGRQSWIVSRMAMVDIFGFFIWTASLSGVEGLLRRRDLVVGVCVNIKSIFNGGVCLHLFTNQVNHVIIVHVRVNTGQYR